MRRWWLPAVLSCAVLAGALFPEPALRDAATRLAAPDVRLRVAAAYVALAPFCGILEAVSLFSTRQHYALAATVGIAAVAWRVRRRRRRPQRSWRAGALALGGVPLVLLALYAVCIFVPRPMVTLEVPDPDLLAVDFHSHTSFSADGAARFTVARNRAWHAAGGWHAAYVTDHRTLAGAELAMTTNPGRAGEGTVLLPAIELRAAGVYLIVLGITPEDRARLASGERRMGASPEHVVIVAIPAHLERIPAARATRLGDLVGIELSDGSPQGLDQLQRERAAVLRLAEERNLAPVAASNNHGWSQTPVSWTLLRIPGWRGLTPERLDVAIRDRLRRDGRRATRVVERYAADPGATAWGLPVTIPAAAWHMLATLTPAERLSWLVWAWGLPLIGWAAGRGARA